MGINVHVNLGNIAGKASKAAKFANYALTQQVLKDSNYYAPIDQGYLRNSSIYFGVDPTAKNKMGNGQQRVTYSKPNQIIWDTPYARRLYYNPQYNFSKDINPNAGGKWFERAQAAYGKQWPGVAQRAVNEYLKRT